MNKIPKPFIVVIGGTVGHTHWPQKKEQGYYPAIVTELVWSIKDRDIFLLTKPTREIPRS